MIRVAISGYFNPIHIGHIKYMEEAKSLGDELIVIVNNDAQVKLKGSKSFMNEQDRLAIVRAIKYVDRAILSIDTDRTVKKTLTELSPDVFAKGGDSTDTNVPELSICEQLGIAVVMGVGGNKIQSSSKLLKGISESNT